MRRSARARPGSRSICVRLSTPAARRSSRRTFKLLGSLPEFPLSPDPGRASTPSTIPPAPPTPGPPPPAKPSPRGSAIGSSSGKRQLASGCPMRSSQTYSPQVKNIRLSLSELRKMDLTNGCSNQSARHKWQEGQSFPCALLELQKGSTTLYEDYNPTLPVNQLFLQTTCLICNSNCLVSLLDILTPPTPSHTC